MLEESTPGVPVGLAHTCSGPRAGGWAGVWPLVWGVQAMHAPVCDNFRKLQLAGRGFR